MASYQALCSDEISINLPRYFQVPAAEQWPTPELRENQALGNLFPELGG